MIPTYTQLLLHCSPAGIITYRASGQAVTANPAIARMLGATEHQLVAQNFRQLASWKRSGLLEAADRALATESPQELEVEFVTTFGKPVRLAAQFVPFHHDGELHLLGLFLDVAEQRQAEQARLQAAQLQEQLANIAGSVPGIIYSFRLRPNGAMSIPYASGLLRTLFGISPQQVHEDATPALALIHPDDLPQVQSSILASAATMTPWRSEFRVQRKDAPPVWIEAHSVPQRERDGSVLWHGFMQDISHRKQLEAQLLHAQKMESIGQLAGGVAHDFNNLLTIIQGHASLLSLDSDLNQDTRQSVEDIGLAAERAANLTRQLLTFSRRQVIQPRTLIINDVVDGVARMLSRVMGEHISLSVKGGECPLIIADPGMLEQVLMNLAVNARDAMPKGGEFIIHTQARQVAAPPTHLNPDARPGHYVCLSVRDTGCGIEPGNVARIFEPFFTTKEPGKGTGLGLATVYGIVKQHGGWITVDSVRGQGTCFQIFLPVAPISSGTIESPIRMEPVRGGQETILLVEDERAVRRLARTILELNGYHVMEAASAADALHVWARHRSEIDMLLTDVVMPGGVRGNELAAMLLAEKPALRVVFMSGYNAELIGEDFHVRAGAAYLQKPFVPRDLALCVRNCLDALPTPA